MVVQKIKEEEGDFVRNLKRARPGERNQYTHEAVTLLLTRSSSCQVRRRGGESHSLEPL